MRMTERRRTDLLCGALVVAIVSVQWCHAVGLFEGQRLRDPISYVSDSMSSAAFVAAGMRGEFWPFLSKQLPSLGAPFGASWNDYPTSEDWLYCIVGALARWLGVFGATNVSYWAACVLAGVSMFIVARRFHRSRPFATMAGILYGLTGYVVVRGTVHFALTMYWVVPFHLLTAAWLASRRGIAFRSKKFAMVIVVGVITGWSFVYYAFFGAQLYALALLVRMGRAKRRQPLLVAGVLFVVTATAMLSMNLDTILYMRKHGANAAATYRSPTDVEMYALKPLSLLVPGSQHRWAFFRQLAARASGQSMIQGEVPAPYLGVVQNLMLLGLVVAAAWAVARGILNAAVTWALTVAWLMIGHSVGGQNSVMGLFGMRLLRSTNRVSIVILAFVVLFGAWALPRVLRRAEPWVHWAVALGLALFGTIEAVPVVVTPETIATNHRLAESDRALVALAEARLPRGSAVFELPVMQFPEVAPYAGVDSYELFRPYFYAKHLRFSHGDVKGRSNDGWKFQVASLVPAAMVAELRAKGFSSIYVNLKGYPGQEQLIVDAFVGAGARVLAVADVRDSVFLAL